MTNNSEKNPLDAKDPEFGVDSRYKTKKARISDGRILMEARINRINKLSDSQIVKAKLLQLKFRMEDYLKKPVYQEFNFFTDFLTNYIDTIYDKRINFANDITITPVSLSQVLNNHREPKEDFILKLMLHSELVYKNICEFNKKTWYQVYYHEKVCDTMSNQDKWRPRVSKHVKFENTI